MVFLPYIINGVAIAYAFSYFFSPISGAFNNLLEALRLGMLSRSWLSNEKIVNFVLAFVSLWRFSGYHIILFMAALQSVNQDIMEAATIAGASSWQIFRYIQTPSIMLMVDFALFDNIRGAMQVFDIPFVMTAGGPGYASSTFTLYTIKTAFTFSNFGLASTMAIAIMVMIVIIYVVQNKIIHGIGLYRALGAPILIYVASDLMQLYIYRQFLSTISTSLDESALLDGCSYFQLFVRIIFPLLAPATATVAIIKSITIINDMYIPYLHMPGNKQRTLTTFLMDYANAQQGSWQTLAADIIIIMLPTVLIYVFFQRYILAGVAAGAVKE